MVKIELEGEFYNLPLALDTEPKIQDLLEQLTPYWRYLEGEFTNLDHKEKLLMSTLMILDEKINLKAQLQEASAALQKSPLSLEAKSEENLVQHILAIAEKINKLAKSFED